jgi:hypothetical protein
MAVLDSREYSTHTAYDTGLLAVMNLASSDNMTSHTLLEPAVELTAANSITLHLGRALDLLGIEIHIIFRILIFSERDTAASAVRNLTVFNDPALAPMRSDETVLVSSGRSPCGSTLSDHKAGYGDISLTGLIGHKAVAPCADLNFFLCGIHALEICIKYGLAILLLGIPFILGLFKVICTGI